MVYVKSLVAAVTLLASTVRADYYIDPDSVSLSLRTSWCSSETSTCPLICEQSSTGTPETNTCDPKTLKYGCVCSNGLQPNVSEYSLTLPYFTCQEWGNQCVTACGSDNTCASACRDDHPCGAQNPTTSNATSSATTGTATATGTGASTTANAIYTGLGSTATSTTSGSGAAPNLEISRVAGLVSLTLGIAFGFGMLV